MQLWPQPFLPGIDGYHYDVKVQQFTAVVNLPIAHVTCDWQIKIRKFFTKAKSSNFKRGKLVKSTIQLSWWVKGANYSFSDSLLD